MFFIILTLDTSHLERSPLNDDAETNILAIVVTVETSHLEMSPSNSEASPNKFVMSVTLDTSHLEMSPLNPDRDENMLAMLVTLDTSHFERSPLNEVTRENMPCILVTLDTSHLEMSPLNLSASGRDFLFAFMNNQLISVTAETSQDASGPFEPLEQSKSPPFRHPIMAAWSHNFVFGVHPVCSAAIL